MMLDRIQTYIFIVLLWWAATDSMAQFGDETFDQVSTGQGLSSSVVTTMLKDSRGFMWFGTQDGLNRFDGYSFVTYRHSDTVPGSLSGNYILTLFEDSKGNIWVGTENNGLNRYDRLKDEFTAFVHDSNDPASISSNTVRDLMETGNGHLVVGTNSGINIYNGDDHTFSLLPLPAADTLLNHLPVFELFLDTDSSLWIGSSNGLYHLLDAQQTVEAFFHEPGNKSSLSNNFINSILRTTTGILIIGTNRGLNVFNPETRSFTRYLDDPGEQAGESEREVQALEEDARGNLWVGLFGGGLYKTELATGRRAHFVSNPDQPGSLSNDYINSLSYDDSGILWIGTYGGGINMIDLAKIRFDQLEASASDRNSLSSNDVYSILPFDGEVWFGTEMGISIWDRDLDTFRIHQAKGRPGDLSGNAIYCITADANGNVWVGTASEGLNLLRADMRRKGEYTFVPYRASADTNSGLVHDAVLCLYASPDDALWVGTSGGISVIRNEQVIANFISDSADSTTLADNEIYCIRSDRDGHIWIGTFMGLNRFNPADSSFVFYDRLIGDESVNTIYCIHEDGNGIFWIGTDNSGLIKFDPSTGRTIKHYTKADQLPDNVIYGILQDPDGNLWLSSNNGLTKAIPQSGSDNLTFIHYSTANFLNTDSYNIGAYAAGEDETMYFGSFEGVTYFHPDNVKGNTTVPPVYITGFELFFQDVVISDDNSTPLSAAITETSELRLRHDQNVLKFEFSALNYINPRENRYAFMMENLEDRWNYVGNQREAQYMYMPPGEYVFRVRAANNDGVWNETGASLKITITPPFTQTIWFFLIIIAGLTIIIFWIMSLRTRRLKAARDRLEKQVQKRTQELRETNENLEEEIRERKKVQEELARSEARFRQLIETMNEGFTVIDKAGRINYVNPKICEMFGMTAEEALGKNPLDFIDDSSPVYRERFIRFRDESIRSGRVESYEMNWKRKDGSIFVAMVSPRQIMDEDNKYSGSVAVLTDITDLKNAEKELIKRNKDLNTALDDLKKTQAQLIDSEKMASLGQLTAGVAHEINNPINFVSGNVQPLRRDIDDILSVLREYDRMVEQLNLTSDFEGIGSLKKEIDFDFVLSEINNLLDGIGEGASRTAEIVKGLRNFSRMDEHELKLASINQGIESTLLILHNKLKNRIEIIKDYGDFPDIMCYPGQLNQVFMNLLNNAQEAIDGNGTITIRTWKEKGHVKISVKDSGKGIPEKVRKKIFDPFYTTKEVGKGTGLGLAISFGIIEKHNGTIQVNSEPGKGAEFILAIPDNLI